MLATTLEQSPRDQAPGEPGMFPSAWIIGEVQGITQKRLQQPKEAHGALGSAQSQTTDAGEHLYFNNQLSHSEEQS